MLDLTPIKDRCDKATPGPWITGGCSGRMITTPDGYVGDGFIADVDLKVHADFIAHARDDIPALIAEIETLQSQLNGEKANAIIQEQIIDKQHNPVDSDRIVRLSLENADLRAQLAAYTIPCPDLDEIDAECEAATRGPWETANKSVRVAGSQQTYSRGKEAPSGYQGGICNCLGGNSYHAKKNDPVNVQARANATFIVHAREHVPALTAEIRRLRAELEEAQRRGRAAVESIKEYVIRQKRRAEIHCTDESHGYVMACNDILNGIKYTAARGPVEGAE